MLTAYIMLLITLGVCGFLNRHDRKPPPIVRPEWLQREIYEALGSAQAREMYGDPQPQPRQRKNRKQRMEERLK